MPLQRTPLFDWHSNNRGRMVEFGGWEMPVQYTTIAEEHHVVRKAVGLFDISHMGRLRFQGADAERLLDHLLTCRVDNLVDGQIRYGLICNDAGHILDDVLVNRFHATSFGLVVNASNRLKIVDWINQHISDLSNGEQSFDLLFHDETLDTGMIAVQGPRSLALIQQMIRAEVSTLRYYFGLSTEVDGVPVFISRTGYTGEDGFELIVPSTSTVQLWEKILAAGQAAGVQPCGLGCRDTLRLEAAMPLYGHELSESIDPLTAGLKSAVKLEKSDFIGKEALLRIADQSDRAVRVGIKLTSKRIAREHSGVFVDNDQVGEVTSGTFSPTLDQSIAMAYLSEAHSKIGTPVSVDIRGKREAAQVVPLPFYKREK